MVHMVSVLPKITVKLCAKYWLLTPSLHGKWDDVIWCEIHIAAWVLCNLPWMYKKDWKSPWQHIWPPRGQYSVFSIKNTLKFQAKITNFVYQFSPGNVVMWQKNIHPLLLKCFLTFLGYMNIIKIAFDSISNPLMVNAASFYQNKFWHLTQNNQFWAPDQPGKCDTDAGI